MRLRFQVVPGRRDARCLRAQNGSNQPLGSSAVGSIMMWLWTVWFLQPSIDGGVDDLGTYMPAGGDAQVRFRIATEADSVEAAKLAVNHESV